MGHDDPAQKDLEDWTALLRSLPVLSGQNPVSLLRRRGLRPAPQGDRRLRDDDARVLRPRGGDDDADGERIRRRAGRDCRRARADGSKGAHSERRVSRGDGGRRWRMAPSTFDARGAPGRRRPAPPSRRSTCLAGSVEGTLLLPAKAASGKVPVVLIVAGSGPTDRDGNSAGLPGQNNSYRMLAEALAADGIASLRYDKRGIGTSKVASLQGDGSPVRDLRPGCGVVGVVPAQRRAVRHHHRRRAQRRLAHRHAGGTGRARRCVRLDRRRRAEARADVLRDQLRAQARGQRRSCSRPARTILTSLHAGQDASRRRLPRLAALFRPSVQPYLISWFKYVPVGRARPPHDSGPAHSGHDRHPGAGRRRRRRCRPRSPKRGLQIVDGMNHVLKSVTDPAKQFASYSDPTLPIVADVPQAIGEFVRGTRAPGPDAAAPSDDPAGQPARHRPRRRRRRALRDRVRPAVQARPRDLGHARAVGRLVDAGRRRGDDAHDERADRVRRSRRAGGRVHALHDCRRASDFALIINRETGQYHTVYNAESRPRPRPDDDGTRRPSRSSG